MANFFTTANDGILLIITLIVHSMLMQNTRLTKTSSRQVAYER